MKIHSSYLPLILCSLIGIGFISNKISLTIVIFLFIFSLFHCRKWIENTRVLLFIFLWILFFISYYFFYIPPDLPWGRIPLDFFEYSLKCSIPLVLMLLIALTSKEKFEFQVLISISLGMISIATANLFFTWIYLDPPYYGKALHAIHKVITNSPGNTLLGMFLPITMISFWNGPKNQSVLYSISTAIAILLSLFISIFFSARTPVLMLILAVFIKLCLLISYKRINLQKPIFIYGILFLITIIILIIKLNNSFVDSLIYRLINGNYNTKFIHHFDYWVQVSKKFWIYPVASFSMPESYFHNFFYDTHRTSGPVPAIIAFLILFISLFLGIFRIKRKHIFVSNVLLLLILLIPVLMTTIPWEYSESQILTFYSVITVMIAKRVFRKF